MPRLDESRSQTYRSDPSRAEGGRVNREIDLDEFAPRGRSERGRADGRGPDGRGPDGRGPDGRGRDGRNPDVREEDGRDQDRETGPLSRSQEREAATSRSGRASSGRGGGGSHSGSHSGGGNGGGNRKLAVIGGTVGVVVLALIAYFVTRPSGGSSAAGATADATTSQGAIGAATSATASSGAGASPSASSNPTASTSPAASASTSAPAGTVAVIKSEVHVAVFNGSNVNQRAATIKTALVNDGFTLATVGGTLAKTAVTKVYYPSTRADSAAAVAKALSIPTANLSLSTMYTQVTLVIGTDWTTGNTYPAG
jgi:hypothetical protein